MNATVIVADDHPIVLQGVRSLLQNEGDLRVIGEASDGRQALALVERLKPDVLILDIVMPGLGGLEVASQLHRKLPELRIIILSMQRADAYVLEAFRRGAVGYVLKETAPSELVRAIRDALAGRRYLSASLSRRLRPTESGECLSDPYELLTEREREVLQLVAEGLTSAQIGHRLSISHRTVELHRANMMRKLGLETQAAIIRFALERGLAAPKS